MAVRVAKRKTMIAIPSVYNCLPSISRDASYDVEWLFRVMAWVSLLQNLFSGDKSTVLRGDPSCVLATTMW